MRHSLPFNSIAVLLSGIFVCSSAPAAESLKERAVALGCKEVLFAERGSAVPDFHWYANFGYFAIDPTKFCYGGIGGSLKIINLETGAIRVLLEDAKGDLRDPQVHYDADKVLFSWRKGGQKVFHLYEIKMDGTGLRQLTDGIYDDIEPSWLPNGDIVFLSSRCKRWVPCWSVQVATLYRCGPDGKNVRPISTNIETENTPWPLPDGRILYTRWEYVDRSQIKFHGLWTANPDGTGVANYWGNMNPNGVWIDAKPIPGTREVVCIYAPGHGKPEHAGQLAVIDPSKGPDALDSLRIILPGNMNSRWSAGLPSVNQVRATQDPIEGYRDPYPLSVDLFLVAQDQKLLLAGRSGEKQELFASAKDSLSLWVHEPRPLMKRNREPVIPDRVQPSETEGSFILADVTLGRNMGGVTPGVVKKLLVLEVLPKPLNTGMDTSPSPTVSLHGSFFLERILGTVPVEPDGSAYFKAPVHRALFFVALDEQDLSVKRMHSFTSLMPGETQGCLGCHESRTQAPAVGQAVLQAVLRPPSRIEPIPGIPEVFDYRRDIQPILDKNCLSCHSSDKPSGTVVLSGDRGERFTVSYLNLFHARQIKDGGGEEGLGNSKPYSVGSSASPLMKKLSGQHHNVRLSTEEVTKIRLWIEAAATHPGTYAALGTGGVNAIGYGESAKPFWAMYEKRCAECHAKNNVEKYEGLKPLGVLHRQQLNFLNDIVNLTHPDHSRLLLMPLDSKKGGWANSEFSKHPVVFADKNDADYQKLLVMITGGQKKLEQDKRFDMPGFRPSIHYLREMKRYGVLPETFDVKKDIANPYELDAAYWKSFWYHPPAAGSNETR